MSHYKYKTWLEKQNQGNPITKRPIYLIDPNATPEQKAEWRRLTWSKKCGPEEAAERVGISGKWIKK